MKSIAIFDFDNTLTITDTLPDFIIFAKGKLAYYFGLAILSPILILYILKLLSNNKAKELLFSYYFKNYEEKIFSEICTRYDTERLPTILNKQAIDKFMWHKNQNHMCIIISSSLISWIHDWAFHMHFDNVLATVPEVINGKLTGRFKSKNCYGIEKLNRFKGAYPDYSECYLYVYGDSSGDNEILEIANEKFFRRFT